MPRNFAAEVRKERETLAAEIIREIRQQVPEFARPLAGQFGAGIQYGVETALAEFADLIDSGRSTAAGTNGHALGSADRVLSEERLHVYRALGRGELAEGRSLDALQAAYRLGARVAWRRYARVARRCGLGSDLVVTLAEAIFAHIDAITSASVQGYAEAKADHAGTHGRLRHHLLELLVAGPDLLPPGSARAELEQAAAAADWPLPELIAGVALGPQRAPAAGPVAGGRRRRLPDPVLADLDCADPYLLVPDPARLLRDDQVRAALQGRGAVIGPTVPVGLAAESLRWARTVRAASATAGIPGAEPLNCDDRLPDLLLLSDAALVGLMSARRLRPLATLTAKQSERLAATLLAWLQTNSGSAPEVAARLGIHPQTARQRLHRVQQLFGPDLHDPDARFELEVALRGRLLELRRTARSGWI